MSGDITTDITKGWPAKRSLPFCRVPRMSRLRERRVEGQHAAEARSFITTMTTQRLLLLWQVCSLVFAGAAPAN